MSRPTPDVVLSDGMPMQPGSLATRILRKRFTRQLALSGLVQGDRRSGDASFRRGNCTPARRYCAAMACSTLVRKIRRSRLNWQSPGASHASNLLAAGFLRPRRSLMGPRHSPSVRREAYAH
jgi:hypothetical protein